MAKKRATVVNIDTLDLPGVLRVFREVALTGETRVIVQGGREFVRVVPPRPENAAERIGRRQPSLQELRARASAAIQSIGSPNDEASEEEVMAEIDEVIAEVRRERREGNG